MGVRSRSSAGGAQFGLSVSTTVVTLTVPNAANVAEIYVRTASVVFTRDGTDPTATAGIRADPGSVIFLNSREECETFEVIRQGGVNATLDVEYFTDLPSGSLLAGATPVQGLAAHDAAVVGNPILLGAEMDETSPDLIDEGDIGRARMNTRRALHVALRRDDADAAIGSRGFKDADGITNDVSILGVMTYPLLYNAGADSTSMDRMRNNVQANNYIAASLVSATQNGADRTNYNAKGLAILVDVTARNGTSTITIALQLKDGNGNYKSIATAAAALSATGQAMYLIYPTAENVEGWTEHFNTVLGGRTYRVIATYGGSDTISFDVDVVELMA